MKLLPLARLLAALPLLAGCETHYTRLRVTNPRGELVSDWVARGPVWHTEAGYRVTAVERTEGCPFPSTARYPDGWQTIVAGANIHRWRCAKPAWLDDEDGK